MSRAPVPVKTVMSSRRVISVPDNPPRRWRVRCVTIKNNIKSNATLKRSDVKAGYVNLRSTYLPITVDPPQKKAAKSAYHTPFILVSERFPIPSGNETKYAPPSAKSVQIQNDVARRSLRRSAANTNAIIG